MLRPQRTAVVAAVVVAGLGMPGLAHASSPSVQIQLCNRGAAGTFEITGLNQHNARVSSPLVQIPEGSCQLIANWWWKTGQTVRVAVRRSSLNVWDFHLGSDVRNGSTVTYTTK